MSETNHAARVLIASEYGGEGDYRGYLHLCDPAESREEMVRSLLDASGRGYISASHLYAVVAGPENPAYETAVKGLGLISSPVCSARIVSQAMELMVMSELFPPFAIDDDTMRISLETLFATESDWESIPESAARAIIAWGSDPRRREPLPLSDNARALLTGSLSTAIAKARADWTV